MSRDGNGTYTAPVNSWNPAINGVLATAGDYQALLNDIVAALTQSVSRDGQSPMTGPLNMGNNKITGVTAGTGTGEALAFQQLFAQGTQADLASAATTDIGAQNTTFLRITGNTTITSFGTQYRGPRFLVFEGAVTLTNSSTLVLPGNANITTAAGDVLIAIPGATLGTADKWIVTAYQKNTSVSNPNFDALQVAGNNISAAGGFSFKNRLINANPIINQRGYVSGTATTTANQYTLDRWRVVTSGQSVSWTDSGLTRTVTCPAGGWEQVIESLNIEGGTFVLSWTGTATATVNGTAVVKNGTFTLPANTNATVRFSSGTLSNPQIEAGTVATPFERRDYGRELMMCQRYCVTLSADDGRGAAGAGIWYGTTAAVHQMRLPVQMRTAPTLTNVTPAVILHIPGAVLAANAPTINYASAGSVEFYTPVTSGSTTAGFGTSVTYSSGKSILSAEL